MFRIGTQVLKNPATWEPNDFDWWGRGEGIGIVVESPFPLEDDTVCVIWPQGQSFEEVKGLLTHAHETNETDGPLPGETYVGAYRIARWGLLTHTPEAARPSETGCEEGNE